jgi:diacylglycerol O-acyltransferase
VDNGRRLGIQDALWLEMDRPNNLMVVDSVTWTSKPIDPERFRAVIASRLSDRYPAFRSRAVEHEGGTWYWEDDPDFDVDAHIEHVHLPEPAGDQELQEFVATQRTVMLDRHRPLWRAFLVDNFKGGSAMVLRSHHALADGIRMVQLAMTLFDANAKGSPIRPPSTRHVAEPLEPGQPLPVRLQRSAAEASRQMRQAMDAAARLPAAMIEASGQAFREFATNPFGATHGAVRNALAGVGPAMESMRANFFSLFPGGGPAVDLFSGAPGDVEFARKLLLGTRNDNAVWTGTAGVKKAVAWSEPLPLSEVKAVARANLATVNDVLVTCVALALHRYLDEHHWHCASVNWMIPVNLRPFDPDLPDVLGNGFALVQLELPTDSGDPLGVLTVVRRRMGRIKRGHEAALAFRIQEVISGLNRSIYEATVDLLANRAVGVLTNVPGPPMPVFLAGQKVEGMVGWAPLSGNQPMSFTIYSYDGKVFVGIACDAGLVPDHEHIVEGFGRSFARLQAASPEPIL